MMKTRTTLTLDDDVVTKLHSEMRRTGKSFKETVNEFLRLGLQAKRPPKTKKRFVVKARSMGLRPSLNYDKVGELLEQLEGPLTR
jgi:hypothetical protein